MDEKTITDEVLNKNSDFYALYLALKRAKTPMAMDEAIKKYKDVLVKHEELCKTITAFVETLYKRFNQDSGASNVRFASLEEAIKMIESDAIDWKKNMREELYNKWVDEGKPEWKDAWREEWKNEGKLEGKNEGKLEVALAMLQEGLSLEMIGRITKLPLTEIEKLEPQRV